jgi:hypothetical protein
MKTNFILLAAAGTTVLAFGLYLSLGSPFSEEKPSQIKNIECTEYQFSWYDAEIGDSVISTAWEFKPSQLPSLNDLISKSDTTWSFTDEDGKSNVYWSKDITVQALYKADTLNKVMVYWSEEF